MNILVLILFLFIILFMLNLKEPFNNHKSKKFINIFKTNIFENKTIFLIANNPNLSKKTQNFLNNFDYKDSLIIRFNGYKPIVKDYCNSKTDIMVYRKNINGFHGYNKNDYNKNIINVFTKDHNDNETEFDDNYFIKDNKYLKLPPLSYTYNAGFTFKHLNYPKKCKCSWTTGLIFLIYLIHLKNIKKIYLVGYTFHNKKNECHCEEWEYNYFKENIENKYNIQILL